MGLTGRFEEEVSRRFRLWKNVEIQKILVLPNVTLEWDLSSDRLILSRHENKIARGYGFGLVPRRCKSQPR